MISTDLGVAAVTTTTSTPAAGLVAAPTVTSLVTRTVQTTVQGAPSYGGVSGTTAVVVACIALVGVILTAVISGINGRTAAHAARSAAGAAGRAAAGSNRASTQLETWRQRQESLVNLRWAADLALSEDVGTKQKGVDILTSLSKAALVQAEDLPFITAVLTAVVAPVRGRLTRDVSQRRSDG